MEKKYFFLIDDDRDDQEIFSMAVAQANESFDCICTDDCVDALKKIIEDKEFKPHAIFIDVNMPQVNGLKCLEEMRKAEHHNDTPVYIYTTSKDEKIRQQSLALGATGFIVKPSNLNSLIEVIERIIEEPTNSGHSS